MTRRSTWIMKRDLLKSINEAAKQIPLDEIAKICNREINKINFERLIKNAATG